MEELEQDKEYAKINIAMISGDCEQFIDICFESIPQEINKIIFVSDTASKDKTIEKVEAWKDVFGNKLVIIKRDYEHEHIDTSGKARNIYLDYLKLHHLHEWCLVINSDEVMGDDGSKLIYDTTILEKKIENIRKKEFNKNTKIKSSRYDYDFIFNIKIEYFIGNLINLDRMVQTHYAIDRLFMISDRLIYSETEQSMLIQKVCVPESIFVLNYLGITLWNLSHVKNMMDILQEYNNMIKSNIQSSEYLKVWLHSHIMGMYPIEKIDIAFIPKIIKKKFHIPEDLKITVFEKPRNHFELTMEKFDKFMFEIKDKITGNKILDVGCRDKYNKDRFERKKFIWEGIDSTPVTSGVTKGDMTALPYENNVFDIIFCCHAFEHCENPIKALKEMYRVTKFGGYIFISTPSPCKEQIIDGDKDHLFVLTPVQMKKLLTYTQWTDIDTSLQYEGIDLDRNYNVISYAKKTSEIKEK